MAYYLSSDENSTDISCLSIHVSWFDHLLASVIFIMHFCLVTSSLLSPNILNLVFRKNPLTVFICYCVKISLCFIPTDLLFKVYHLFRLLYFMQPRNYRFVNKEINIIYVTNWRTRWRSLLRHCATSWKVAGSIPAGVTGIFRWHNPSGRTMALGSSQSLK